MDADVQTGPRPISRRQFKRGGKVAGEAAPARADRKPRASGGALTANSLINRDVKSANEDRSGTKHVGGFKAGGGVHGKGCDCGKCSGGRVGRREGGRTEYEANRALAQTAGAARPMGGVPPLAIPRPSLGGDPYNSARPRPIRKDGGKVRHGPAINDGTRPVAGRLARKGGGRTKKGTNVNIIIAPQGGGQKPPMPMPPMGAPPPGGPVGMHQGTPPPAPMGPPAGAPPPMMARKSGGRTLEKDGGKLVTPGAYPIDNGAGGGLGRLEKAKAERART